MNLQWPEAAAELCLLARRDKLIAEDQHMMIEMGRVDAGEVHIADGAGQIQAHDFRAQWRIKNADIEALARCREFGEDG
jgi:hypothetical protein